MASFRLPDGTVTHKRADYIRAWEDLANPILQATGLTLLSFDPAVRIGTPDGKLNVALPVWFLEGYNARRKP